jgi:hypothetical protein
VVKTSQRQRKLGSFIMTEQENKKEETDPEIKM